jgi:hypothetical protein
VREETTNRYFDELASGLASGTISRRQALKWAGFGVLGTALSSLGFADTAEAIRPRKCRRRLGGTPLDRGECDCAFNCATSDFSRFVCENDPECGCGETTEGRGVCARINIVCQGLPQCSSSGECPSGHKCILDTCCGPRICFPLCSVDSIRSTSAASGRTGAALNGRSS